MGHTQAYSGLHMPILLGGKLWPTQAYRPTQARVVRPTQAFGPPLERGDLFNVSFKGVSKALLIIPLQVT